MTALAHRDGKNYNITLTGTLDQAGRGTLYISNVDSLTFYYDVYNNFLYSANLNGSPRWGYCSVSRS